MQRSSDAQTLRIDEAGIVCLACQWGVGRRQRFPATITFAEFFVVPFDFFYVFMVCFVCFSFRV